MSWPPTSIEPMEQERESELPHLLLG